MLKRLILCNNNAEKQLKYWKKCPINEQMKYYLFFITNKFFQFLNRFDFFRIS